MGKNMDLAKVKISKSGRHIHVKKKLKKKKLRTPLATGEWGVPFSQQFQSADFIFLIAMRVIL